MHKDALVFASMIFIYFNAVASFDKAIDNIYRFFALVWCKQTIDCKNFTVTHFQFGPSNQATTLFLIPLVTGVTAWTR